MYAPTEGDALVYGKSLVNQLDDVRKNLGVCFQQNLMMKVLTVGEAARRYRIVSRTPRTLRQTAQGESRPDQGEGGRVVGGRASVSFV